MYGSDGERVSARDVLSPDELADYYRNKDRHPSRAFKANGRSVLRDEDGWFSTDGGQTWSWEPS